MNIYILVTQFCLLRSLALPHYEDKKTKARQGFGPEGKHVLTEEEETNGISIEPQQAGESDSRHEYFEGPSYSGAYGSEVTTMCIYWYWHGYVL